MKKSKYQKKAIDKINNINFTKKTIKIESTNKIKKMINRIEKLEEYENITSKLREQRPKIKNEIQNTIKQCLSFVKKFQPLLVLTYLCNHNLLVNPENYKESTHQGKEIFIEYTLSMILSLDKLGTKNPEPKDLLRFQQDLTRLYNLIINYFLTENIGMQEDRISNQIRFEAIQRFINFRGDSFPQHHLELVADLFTVHNDFLMGNFQFNTNSIILTINEIYKQINKNVNLISMNKNQRKLVQKIKKKYEDFLSDQRERITRENYWSYREEFMHSEEGRKLNLKLLKEIRKLKINTYKIELNADISKFFLNEVSSTLQDNKDNFFYEKSPGWPTNNTVIRLKPIVYMNSSYYAFGFNLLVRNIIKILENLIQQNDNDYFENIYTHKRGKFLENKTSKYFRTIFPNAKIYQSLFYYPDPSNIAFRPETDILIIVDKTLLIIEVKAGKYSLPARRGAMKSLIQEIKKLIVEAYEQAHRVLDYIQKNKTVSFMYEDEKPALQVSKSNFDNIYMINVTLENLGPLATQINNLREIKEIEGDKFLWSVFINDLRIISDLIITPSEFLYFLERREEVSNINLYSADEVDYFINFQKYGLFIPENSKENDFIVMESLTDELDQYYLYKAGKRSRIKKPKSSFPLLKLVEKIDHIYKTKHSTLGKDLLSIDYEDQMIIKNFIMHEQDQMINIDSYVIFDQKPNFLINFCKIRKKKYEKLHRIINRSNNLCKKLGLNNWYLIKIYKKNKKLEIKIKCYN